MASRPYTRRSEEKGRYIMILVLLCLILVFSLGLILTKQQDNPTESQPEVVQTTAALQTTAPPVVTASVETTTVAPTETLPETTESTTTEAPSAAASFSAKQAQLYIRINRTQTIELENLPAGQTVTWKVDNNNVADVDSEGNVTGLQKGSCTVQAICGEEVLEIPVTVRELVVQDGCTYVDGILVANKSYSLPEDYDPGMLPVTKDAFERLCQDAAAAGLNIYEGSGYRTYAFQVEVYQSMIDAYGKEYTDAVSARPGHSEHQTGYTVDCNTIDDAFGETAEGEWLAKHCWEYGFIIRYPEGKEAITGYDYESWHIRYVGVEHAKTIWEQGLTLEEYLDIESKYAE